MVAYRPTELIEERADSDAIVRAAATTCTPSTPPSLRLFEEQQPLSTLTSSCRTAQLLFNPRFIFEQARRRHDVPLDDALFTTKTTRESSVSNTTAATDRPQKSRKDSEYSSNDAILPPPPTTKALTAKETTETKKAANTSVAGEVGASMESTKKLIRAGKKPITLKIPEELKRPAFQEVSNEAITTADPRLDGVAPQYVRDQLEDFGSSWLFGMAGVKIVPPKNNNLLSHLDVVYPNVATIPPTHMIAVFKSLRPRPTHLPVTVFPVHSIFLAAHCARLPPSFYATPAPSTCGPLPPEPSRAEGEEELERASSSGSDSDSGSSGSAATATASSVRKSCSDLLILPVHAIALPDPDTFSVLIGYLYHKRTDILLEKLLPLPPPPKLEYNQLTEIPKFGREIGRKCRWETVFWSLWRVRGLWMNVCHLGIFDEFLWDTMDLVWEVLLVAWGMEQVEKQGGQEEGGGQERGVDGADVRFSPLGYEADRSG